MDNNISSVESTRTVEPVVDDDDDDEENEVGCAGTFYDPRRGGHRFIALMLMCIIGFGKMFFSDQFILFIIYYNINLTH